MSGYKGERGNFLKKVSPLPLKPPHLFKYFLRRNLHCKSIIKISCFPDGNLFQILLKNLFTSIDNRRKKLYNYQRKTKIPKGIKMTANYHTHTYRCNHAAPDDERVYVEAAIKAGFRELGFTDHVPIPMPCGVDAAECQPLLRVRMTPDETEGYVSTLLKLREEYKNDIKIYIGYEVEYLPEVFGGIMDHISQYPLDYLILGQHFSSIKDPVYFGHTNKDANVLKQYVDLLIAGIETGKFTYLAHPDLCNYVGHLETYEREMTRLINCANEHKLPLEINFYGFQLLRNYPNIPFWNLAGELGCDVVLGSDAHFPENMCNASALKHSKMLVESHPKLNLLDRISLVDPLA